MKVVLKLSILAGIACAVLFFSFVISYAEDQGASPDSADFATRGERILKDTAKGLLKALEDSLDKTQAPGRPGTAYPAQGTVDQPQSGYQPETYQQGGYPPETGNQPGTATRQNEDYSFPAVQQGSPTQNTEYQQSGYQSGAGITNQTHCYPFNSSNTIVSEFKDGWAVVDSTNPDRAIVSFRKERKGNADLALKVIERYGMNQVCNGQGSFVYYLVSDQAPQGSFPGENCKTFDPFTLTIESRPLLSKTKEAVGTVWVIVNGQKHLWGFKDNESGAREALAVIQRYGFTDLCYAGLVYYRK
jgi:hypothetical protein